jgi:dihydrofolate reductase
MSKVFVSIGISLDGYIAGPNRGPDNPLGDRGASIHAWMYPQQAFRDLLELGGDGQTGEDNRLIAYINARAGATIMGKRMFDEGERAWPENAPFRMPVLVLTHETREPWVRPGGTTFHFVNETPAAALARARDLAGDKDVRISGGAETIREFLEAGLVDELSIALAPIVLGDGLRLFDAFDGRKVTLTPVSAAASTHVTHLHYSVRAR